MGTGAPADRRPRARHTPLPPQPAHPAWLIRLVHPTAQFTGQLEALLASPDLHAFLAAAPQAGRILRPICQMLGIAAPASVPRTATQRPREPNPARHPTARHARPRAPAIALPHPPAIFPPFERNAT